MTYWTGSLIADRLTNLARNQSAPFVISIHGYWGTGKTFMLKRWQKDLERQDFKAIYLNAWEDDFGDDPLLAIIGQLSEYLKEGALRTIASLVFDDCAAVNLTKCLGCFEQDYWTDAR